MNALYLKAGAVLLLIVMACGALFGAYHHGETVANAKWQAKWDKQLDDQANAKAQAEADARAEEQRRQTAIDEVQVHATQALEQARTDAASANVAADSLRRRAEALAAAASRCSSNTGTAATSSPATNPGNLLAVVLDKSVQRNRELAEIADTARVRGLACEAAYTALIK